MALEVQFTNLLAVLWPGVREGEVAPMSLPRSGRVKSLVDALVAPIVLVAALTVVYRNLVADDHDTTRTGRTTVEVPAEPLSLDGAMVRGADEAEAVMIVFADFQCPYCARFARDVQPTIERRYVADGRLAVAFRHLPLPIHAHAAQAAAVAECAGRHGRFWEMHDRLFGERTLDEKILQTIWVSVGLELSRLDECLQDPGIGEAVRVSVVEAGALGIRGTPAFLLGKRLSDGRVEVRRALSGLRSVEEFARELDDVLGDGGPFWQNWVRRVTGEGP